MYSGGTVEETEALVGFGVAIGVRNGLRELIVVLRQGGLDKGER